MERFQGWLIPHYREWKKRLVLRATGIRLVMTNPRNHKREIMYEDEDPTKLSYTSEGDTEKPQSE